MFQQYETKTKKGKRIVKLLGRLTYTESVKNHEFLSRVFQMKKWKDVSKGERIAVPSGKHSVEDADDSIEVVSADFLTQEGANGGAMIFEITTDPEEASMGPKGLSMNIKLCNIEAEETEELNVKWEIGMGEEISVFIPEAGKNKLILTLNEAVVPPKAKELSRDLGKIGKDHLHIFEGTAKAKEDDGRETRGEGIRKLREVRKTLPWLRKAATAKHMELIVVEGGFKKDTWYLENLATASRNRLAGNTTQSEDVEGRWQGLESFTRVERLRLLEDREAFQDFVVNGVWDKKKYGEVLDQFLPASEAVDDNNPEQLARLLRNMTSVNVIGLGSHWRDAFSSVVDRLDDGKLGRVMTRHIKYLVSEVWESVSVALREDNKKVILVKSGIRREFDLNDQDEVVGMVKFRCEGIEETNFLSESEFRRTEVKKKEPEKEEKAKMMSGKKHHNVDKEEGATP